MDTLKAGLAEQAASDGPAEPGAGDAAADPSEAATGDPEASTDEDDAERELAAVFAAEYAKANIGAMGPKLKDETGRALARLRERNASTPASQLLAALVDGLVDLEAGKIKG